MCRILLSSILILLTTLTAPDISLGQTKRAMITGQVLEAKTGKSLPGANVFISQSLLGAASDSSGHFVIRHVPLGRYELVVSMIGYNSQRKVVHIDEAMKYVVDYQLVPKTIVISGIEIAGSQPKNWKKNLVRFKEDFLGTSQNASSCTLVNPEVLTFEAVSRRELRASASSPLIIENNALGYRLKYTLDAFYSSRAKVEFKGVARFEQSSSSEKDDEWIYNRNRAYKGSLRHFLTALQAGHVSTEEFLIYASFEPGDWSKKRLEDRSAIYESGIHPNRKTLIVKRFLEIAYTGEREEMNYVLDMGHQDSGDQVSWIEILKAPAEFYPNGILADPYSVKTYGYWAWHRVCEMLPIEFEPDL